MNDDVSVCCFCFEDVPLYQRVELIVVPKPGSVEEQGLRCHRRCLVERIDSRVPFIPT